MEHDEGATPRLVAEIDEAHAALGAAHRRFLRLIAEMARTRAWEDDGARDLAQWLWMRYGMSDWKARRWIEAAGALPTLPRTAEALDRGELGIDKVVELARFAAPDTEDGLVTWAQQVSAARIRSEGDLVRAARSNDGADEDRRRSVTWAYTDEGKRFEMHADLPAAQGAVVVTAMERVVSTVPPLPHEVGAGGGAARRADALIAVCSSRLANDAHPDRATVVIHTRVDADVGQIEGGGLAPRSTLERLLCSARIETVHEDRQGRAIGVGRITRVPPAWLLRQVRYRDQGCRFPGCGTRSFTQAHHIEFWRDGGLTDLNNLVTICTWHHKLVHEYGWWIKGSAEGDLRWYRPEGTRYRAGPTPVDDALRDAS
jgi:Domain of unknown function (DUF222)/HNH endonuclease